MMQESEDPIVRWRDRLHGGDAPEDRAAAIIRGSLAPGEPDHLPFMPIETRRRRWSRLPRAPRLAFVALFLVVGVATVMAARGTGWLAKVLPDWSPTPTTAPAPARARGHRTRLRSAGAATDITLPDATEAAAPLPETPSAVPAAPADAAPMQTSETGIALTGPLPGTPAAENQTPRRRTRAARRVASMDTPESSPPALSEEIHALDQSIGLLRRDHNAHAALSALEAYLVRYPHGVLNREARLARVDALLALQRLDEAQDALQDLQLDSHRRETELQLIRAELWARSDCARAEQDYSAVLARVSDAALAERALYGRGACRAKRGDNPGAADDLRRYLERFPTRSHAEWARQWLESMGRSFKKGG